MLARFARQAFIRQVLPLHKSCFRFEWRGFAAADGNNGNYQEPEYLVGDDEYLDDPSILKIPYLHDEVKVDIYLKFLADPKKWTVNNLAASIGASPIRIKALLYQMEKRFEKYRELGFEISTTGEPIIPPEWQKLHDLRAENPTMPLSDLSAAAGMPEGTTDDDLNLVLKRMFEHSWRQDNLNCYIEESKESLKTLESIGANPEFQEDNKGQSRMFDNYFPSLLGDEYYETAKKNLLRRLQEETKAVRIRDFDYYVMKHSEVPKKVMNSEGIEELSATETEIVKLENIVLPDHDHSQVKKFSRSKFAFRDLSFNNYKGGRGALSEEIPEVAAATAEKDKDGNVKPLPRDTRRRRSVASFAAPPATMILTRGGFWRRANPLEEAQRSWTRNPIFLDMYTPVNRAKVLKYKTDWDRDEALVAAQVEQRQQRRQVLLDGLAKK